MGIDSSGIVVEVIPYTRGDDWKRHFVNLPSLNTRIAALSDLFTDLLSYSDSNEKMTTDAEFSIIVDLLFWSLEKDKSKEFYLAVVEDIVGVVFPLFKTPRILDDKVVDTLKLLRKGVERNFISFMSEEPLGVIKHFLRSLAVAYTPDDKHMAEEFVQTVCDFKFYDVLTINFSGNSNIPQWLGSSIVIETITCRLPLNQAVASKLIKLMGYREQMRNLVEHFVASGDLDLRIRQLNDKYVANGL